MTRAPGGGARRQGGTGGREGGESLLLVPLAFLPPHCASLTRRGAEAWVPSRLCHWKAIPVTLSCLCLPVPPPRPQKGGCLVAGLGPRAGRAGSLCTIEPFLCPGTRHPHPRPGAAAGSGILWKGADGSASLLAPLLTPPTLLPYPGLSWDSWEQRRGRPQKCRANSRCSVK